MPWRHDVMSLTSCHDVTKPDLPISACRCARKMILIGFHGFLLGHWVQRCHWFFIFLDVMMSLNLIHLSEAISACKWARKFILFLFPWFCRSLSSKILMIFHSYDVVTSWRHVMTSEKLLYLSQVMNSLERWSCSGFHSFSGCSFSKCWCSCICGMISCHDVTSWRHVNT